MTPEQLAEIKARAAAATPGPWEYIENRFNVEDDNGDHIGSIRAIEARMWIAAVDDVHPPEEAEGNALFIAHARTDIPMLIDEIERLRAENARLIDGLKPFALTADYWDKLVRQGESFGAEDVVPMRIEPYREARAILASIKP